MGFLETIEMILIDMWNYLYNFLCYLFGEEVNEDWLVPPINPGQ